MVRKRDNIKSFRMEIEEAGGAGPKKPRRITIQIDPEDIIAAAAAIIAIMVVVAMIARWVPTDSFWLSLAGCSTAGVVIARIVAARR